MADPRYIFLVDDEPIQNEMLKDFIAEKFLYKIKTYDNGEEALQNMHLHPEIIVLDYHLSAHKKDAKNGVEVLKEIKANYPEVQVIMLSGQDKLEVAVDSMKYGAYDYVIKGETAFSRVENTLNKVSELHRANTIIVAKQKTIYFLIASMIILFIIGCAMYYFNAYRP